MSEITKHFHTLKDTEDATKSAQGLESTECVLGAFGKIDSGQFSKHQSIYEKSLDAGYFARRHQSTSCQRYVDTFSAYGGAQQWHLLAHRENGASPIGVSVAIGADSGPARRLRP